jgi:short-subunit dehydrogenase
MMQPGPVRRTALITGASAGIGTAFAHVFALRGFDLVVTARRIARLEALANQLREQRHVTVHVVPEDLSESGAPGRLQDHLTKSGITIDALVNNAGYGVAGRYLATPWEQHGAFLHVMVTSVAELTHRFLGPMVERRYGRIINVASLAGLVPATAGHTLYAASKALLIKFSESLALEVRDQGVHITALCPGFTYSEFHDVLGTRDIVRQMPQWMWMDADAVARQGFDAVMAGRPVCVTGRVNRTIALLTRHLPDGLLRWTASRQAGKYRRV